MEFFEEIIFSYFQDIKRDKDNSPEQLSLMIMDTFKGEKKEKEKLMIIKGFDSAGVSEAVQNAEDIYEKVENPFKE